MSGMRMPETCWAVFKRQVINSRSCCILLVDSAEKIQDITKSKEYINAESILNFVLQRRIWVCGLDVGNGAVSLGNPFPTFRKNLVFKKLKFLVTPDQKHKHFPKIYEPPQNSTRQNSGIQQARRWLATNIRRHRTKFSHYDDLALGLCASALDLQDEGITFLRNVGKRICSDTSHLRRRQSTVGHWYNVV